MYNVFLNFVVTFSKPPQSITVCRVNDVTIHCGYRSIHAFPVTWIINGTSFDQSVIVNNPLYQLNNPTNPNALSLTVFSINHTTTFQCIVHSTPNTTTSRLATITVTTST